MSNSSYRASPNRIASLTERSAAPLFDNPPPTGGLSNGPRGAHGPPRAKKPYSPGKSGLYGFSSSGLEKVRKVADAAGQHRRKQLYRSFVALQTTDPVQLADALGAEQQDGQRADIAR